MKSARQLLAGLIAETPGLSGLQLLERVLQDREMRPQAMHTLLASMALQKQAERIGRGRATRWYPTPSTLKTAMAPLRGQTGQHNTRIDVVDLPERRTWLHVGEWDGRVPQPQGIFDWGRP